MKKIIILFGTRPEFIKLIPLILLFKKYKSFKVIVCNSMQHKDLIKPFLKFYKIKINHNLNVFKKKQTLSNLTSKILINFEKIVVKEKPRCVIVQGDTTTAFAGSLVSFYNNIKCFHIEAGLRTGNIMSPWPEEFNRQVISKITSHHFTPTKLTNKNLIDEGVNIKNITMTGNTVIDLLFYTNNILRNTNHYKKIFETKFKFLKNYKFNVLISVHRRENFGKPLKEIFTAINELSKYEDLQVIYCIHSNPNVVFSEKKYLKKNKNIIHVKPLDYINFVYLMSNVDFIMSDSGGIQEEAPSLGKPHLILREFTERPEAVSSGSAILSKLNKSEIIKNFKRVYFDKALFAKMSKIRNLYGNGKASKIIIKKIFEKI